VPIASPASKDRSTPAAAVGRTNLALRIISSAVLAPLAIAVAYLGGHWFLAFWAIAAVVVLWEWDTLVCAHDRNPVLAIGGGALVGAGLLMALGHAGTGIALILLSVLGVATLASRIRRYWCAAGVVYAGCLLVAPVVLRSDANWGVAAMLFLFAVVWLTDISAYFAGRAVGGPKLMPRISPHKTWSGAVGGAVAGVVGGVEVAREFGADNLIAVSIVALLLSIVSQGGDLLESAIKRHFHAKDASGLIPGHGGLMDRLDGFVTAAVVAALIGLAHGGSDFPARGLMVW